MIWFKLNKYLTLNCMQDSMQEVGHSSLVLHVLHLKGNRSWKDLPLNLTGYCHSKQLILELDEPIARLCMFVCVYIYRCTHTIAIVSLLRENHFTK